MSRFAAEGTTFPLSALRRESVVPSVRYYQNVYTVYEGWLLFVALGNSFSLSAPRRESSVTRVGCYHNVYTVDKICN